MNKPKGEDVFDRVHEKLRQGKYKAAVELIVNPAGRLNSKFRTDANHAWYCVADAYYRQGEFKSARDAFVKALRSRPDDIAALMAAGNCYDALRMPRYAAHYFSRAVVEAKSQRAGREELSSAAFNLGNALLDLGRFEEAVHAYRDVKSRRPELVLAARKNRSLARDGLSAKWT